MAYCPEFFEEVVKPPLIDQDIVAQLSELPTAPVSDVMDRFGVMDNRIKPIAPGWKLVGTAVTVLLRPADNLMLHKALYALGPGYVLIADTGGNMENAVWGELMTQSALQLGLNGLVVDGVVRDTESLRQLNFPVFAAGTTAQGGDKDGSGKINVPITCGGVPVEPGDAIIGDDDGIVVIPRAKLVQVMNAARKKVASETKRVENIKSGRIRPDWFLKLVQED